MSVSHSQWTAWGDVAESVKDWAITALAAVVVVAALAPLCVATLLLLLNKIGNL